MLTGPPPKFHGTRDILRSSTFGHLGNRLRPSAGLLLVFNVSHSKLKAATVSSSA